MRIALIGQAAFGADVLKGLIKQGQQVVGVFCPPDRGAKLDPLKDAALAAGLPVYQPPRMKDPQAFDQMAALNPDLAVLAFVTDIVPGKVLAVPKLGSICYHPSILPKYRGASAINWAVIKGERETGATLHQMVAKPDAGGVVDQQAVPIGPDDTAAEVFGRVTEAAGQMLARALPALIAGTARIAPQNLDLGSYFGGRKPEDGRIDWGKSAREVHDLVRGVAPPYPGAFTRIGARTLRILRTRPEPNRRPRSGAPGLYFDTGSFYADCGDSKVLRILELEATDDSGSLLDPGAFGKEKITFT